jgi:hypothetical protein
MTQLQITKKTKKTLYITITGKTTKKQTNYIVKDWASVNDAISCLHDRNDIKLLLDASVGILSAADITSLTSHYFPTVKQIRVSKKKASDRQKWFDDNARQLDAMTEHMVNHPGFMTNKPF